MVFWRELCQNDLSAVLIKTLINFLFDWKNEISADVYCSIIPIPPTRCANKVKRGFVLFSMRVSFISYRLQIAAWRSLGSLTGLAGKGASGWTYALTVEKISNVRHNWLRLGTNGKATSVQRHQLARSFPSFSLRLSLFCMLNGRMALPPAQRHIIILTAAALTRSQLLPYRNLFIWN